MSGALREVLARFGFEVDSTKLDAAIKKTDSFTKQVVTLAEKFAGGDIMTKVKDIISELQDTAGPLRSISGQLGIGVGDLQRWQAGASLAGVKTETFTASLRILQKNSSAAAGGLDSLDGGLVDTGDGMLEASLKGKDAAKVFSDLGVSVLDSSGQVKPVTQLMGDVGLAIGGIANPSVRTATAMKIFGKQGAALIPLFNKGEKGLEEYLDRIDDLGGGISEDAIKALGQNSRATKEFNMAVLSLKSAFAEQLLPGLTATIKAKAALLGWWNKLAQKSNVIKAAVLVVGAAMAWQGREAALAGIKTAMAYAPVILGLAAIILIVDDLITVFEGGDSAIADFVDSLFGVGSAKEVVTSLKDLWASVSGSLAGVEGPAKAAAAGIVIAGLAAGTAAAPFVVMAAAIMAVANAFAQASKLKAEWDDQSSSQIGNELKHDLGITSDAEYSAAMRKRQGLVSGDDYDKKKSNDAFGAHLTASENKTAALKGLDINSSLKYLASVPDPGVSSSVYAPSVGAKAPPPVQHNSVNQSVSIPITVTGGVDPKATADGIKGALASPLDESRKAALASLESLAE